MEMLTGSPPITSETLEELKLMPKRDPNTSKPDTGGARKMAVFDVYETVVKSHLPKLPRKTFSQPLENFVASWSVSQPARVRRFPFSHHTDHGRLITIPFRPHCQPQTQAARPARPAGAHDAPVDCQLCRHPL